MPAGVIGCDCKHLSNGLVDIGVDPCLHLYDIFLSRIFFLFCFSFLWPVRHHNLYFYLSVSSYADLKKKKKKKKKTRTRFLIFHLCWSSFWWNLIRLTVTEVASPSQPSCCPLPPLFIHISLSLVFFLFCLSFLWPLPPFIFILIFISIYIFPPMLNFRKTHFLMESFKSKDEISLLISLSILVYPLFSYIYIYIYIHIYNEMYYYLSIYIGLWKAVIKNKLHKKKYSYLSYHFCSSLYNIYIFIYFIFFSCIYIYTMKIKFSLPKTAN